jgi:hypothetical protein
VVICPALAPVAPVLILLFNGRDLEDSAVRGFNGAIIFGHVLSGKARMSMSGEMELSSID